MNQLALPASLLLALACLAPSQLPAAPLTTTGAIGKPEDPGIAQTLGHSGVLFITTEARWKEFQDRLGANMPLNAELPKVDFTKQNLVLVYTDHRRDVDGFTLAKSDLAATPPQLDFLLHWDDRGEEQKKARFTKFLVVPIPVTPSVKVTLSSDTTAQAPVPSVTVSSIFGGKQSADIVDGLRATIAAKAAINKPGEDIKIDFALEHAAGTATVAGQVDTFPAAIYVWDAIYSNGYRNHAYFVTTPDGKTTLLRPKQINQWEKNAPHPIEITAREPYRLPNPTSLKSLGLDTTALGTYTITALYEEIGGPQQNGPNGAQTTLWAGSITSNTLTIEVK